MTPPMINRPPNTPPTIPPIKAPDGDEPPLAVLEEVIDELRDGLLDVVVDDVVVVPGAFKPGNDEVVVRPVWSNVTVTALSARLPVPVVVQHHLQRHIID
jgi:hypothetical protein